MEENINTNLAFHPTIDTKKIKRIIPKNNTHIVFYMHTHTTIQINKEELNGGINNEHLPLGFNL
jgi:CDP-glycerol glycerophosphotransferase (TagB/SpsB family)